jgi:hypothetical protein
MTLRRFVVFSIAALSVSAVRAQTPPAPPVPPAAQPSGAAEQLRGDAEVMGTHPNTPAAGNMAFDNQNPAPGPVDAGSLEPVVTTKPKGFGQDDNNPGGGDQDSEIGRMIRKVLKDPAVRNALDDVRKEQSTKFAKEVVDNVTKDPRVKKLTEGPTKAKQVIVGAGIAGGGALLMGIGFAVGLAPLGFVGIGIAAAGLLGVLFAFL